MGRGILFCMEQPSVRQPALNLVIDGLPQRQHGPGVAGILPEAHAACQTGEQRLRLLRPGQLLQQAKRPIILQTLGKDRQTQGRDTARSPSVQA